MARRKSTPLRGVVEAVLGPSWNGWPVRGAVRGGAWSRGALFGFVLTVARGNRTPRISTRLPGDGHLAANDSTPNFAGLAHSEVLSRAWNGGQPSEPGAVGVVRGPVRGLHRNPPAAGPRVSACRTITPWRPSSCTPYATFEAAGLAA
jgi:hypothetical protein